MENLRLTGRLAAYGRAGLRRDLIAGLTVAAVALPQAMAYAQIAGIPPVYGLYTAVVMTAVASLLGSSSHLINGPTNAISLVVFSAVAGLSLDPRGPKNPEQACKRCSCSACWWAGSRWSSPCSSLAT